jgi:Domain of unknown function (DUF5666)
MCAFKLTWWQRATSTWASRAGVSSLCLALLLNACGGGVGTGGTGSFGNAGGFTSGPITGFGSVIVNAVRYDDTAALVQDGDGISRSKDDLRLGMTVEIESGTVATATATAKANSIRFDSELLGTVASVSVASSSFTLLGQTVVSDAATVFDPAVGSLAALRAGLPVEVFAVFDVANQRYRATRVGTVLAGRVAHLRGTVTQLDAAAQTLRIGNSTYAYGAAAGRPADLGVGQTVRLRLNASTPVNGRYDVAGFGTALRALADSDDAKLKGLITAFTSSAAFSVNGRPVDARTATFPNGSSGLRAGARVEVEGSLRSNVLVAKKVTFEEESGGGNQTFEVSGAITTVDAAAKTFVVRSLTIATARADLKYENGTAANLVVGRSVEVKGKLSVDGLRIDATSIKFE